MMAKAGPGSWIPPGGNWVDGLRIVVHRVGGLLVISAVSLGPGGELQEDVERDDLHGLAQAAEDVGDLFHGVALADVHEEEVGALRVELDELPEVGRGLLDGARGGPVPRSRQP